MTKTTRQFLKDNGLMFKAAYAGLSAFMEKDSSRPNMSKSSYLWNISLSSGAERFSFEMRTPADTAINPSGSRIEPPTPEIAIDALTALIKPASMGHVEWGNHSFGQTSPLKFGDTYTSQQLEEAPPDSLKQMNTVGREYVASVSAFNMLLSKLGPSVTSQVSEGFDSAPVAIRVDQQRTHAPSMR
jgi:hypothetical protein